MQASSFKLRVLRKNVFMESYNYFKNAQINELRGKIRIEFIGEEGYDAGGLTREWYEELAKEIFNAGYGLFKPSSTGNTY